MLKLIQYEIYLRGALYEMGSKIRFFFIALIDRYII